MRLLNDYLDAANTDDDGNQRDFGDERSLYKGYLFRSVSTDGKQLRPINDATESKGRIDRNAVVNAYRQLSLKAGLGDIYSGHSPRVGAAVSLAEVGEDGLTIQREGRWTSPVMPVRYTKKVRSKKSGMAKLRGGKR
jgi:hypothetical protein